MSLDILVYKYKELIIDSNKQLTKKYILDTMKDNYTFVSISDMSEITNVLKTNYFNSVQNESFDNEYEKFTVMPCYSDKTNVYLTIINNMYNYSLILKKKENNDYQLNNDISGYVNITDDDFFTLVKNKYVNYCVNLTYDNNITDFSFVYLNNNSDMAKILLNNEKVIYYFNINNAIVQYHSDHTDDTYNEEELNEYIQQKIRNYAPEYILKKYKFLGQYQINVLCPIHARDVNKTLSQLCETDIIGDCYVYMSMVNEEGEETTIRTNKYIFEKFIDAKKSKTKLNEYEIYQ